MRKQGSHQLRVFTQYSTTYRNHSARLVSTRLLSALAQVVLVNMTPHPLELHTRVDFAGDVWKYPVPSLVAPEKGANFLHAGDLLGFGASSGGLSYATRPLCIACEYGLEATIYMSKVYMSQVLVITCKAN